MTECGINILLLHSAVAELQGLTIRLIHDTMSCKTGGRDCGQKCTIQYQGGKWADVNRDRPSQKYG